MQCNRTVDSSKVIKVISQVGSLDFVIDPTSLSSIFTTLFNFPSSDRFLRRREEQPHQAELIP